MPLKRVLGVLLLLVGCDGQAPLGTGVDPVEEPACPCRLATEIDNLSICVSVATAFSPAHVYSTHLPAQGGAPVCEPRREPQPLPSEPWSRARISGACAGDGELCIRLRSGDLAQASETDCVLTSRCVRFDYREVGAIHELAPLPGWLETNECAARFEQVGGYLEFDMASEELGCGPGTEHTKRVRVCPVHCEADPGAAGCESCGGPRVAVTF